MKVIIGKPKVHNDNLPESLNIDKNEITVPPIDNRKTSYVIADGENVKIVYRFCYPSDMLTPGEGCDAVTDARCKTVWWKLKELLYPLSKRVPQLVVRVL